jgi:hypothetical protein
MPARIMFAILAAALALACTPVCAQSVLEQKGLKLGAGCIGPISTLAPQLSTCRIANSKTRIWCPNGQIFDRPEEQAPYAIVRSICNLLQVP